MAAIGGVIFFKVDGKQYKAKGTFTYNLGGHKREMIAGADSVHGYKTEIKVPFIEGAITDAPDLDVKAFQSIVDSDVILELANGKTVVLNEACYTSDGDVTTEEGEIPVRFEGKNAKEV